MNTKIAVGLLDELDGLDKMTPDNVWTLVSISNAVLHLWPGWAERHHFYSNEAIKAGRADNESYDGIVMNHKHELYDFLMEM